MVFLLYAVYCHLKKKLKPTTYDGSNDSRTHTTRIPILLGFNYTFKKKINLGL